MPRNKYPGTCYRCGDQVEAGAGHYERHAGTWRTQHAACAIKYRGTDHHFFKACAGCGAALQVEPAGRGWRPGDFEQHEGRRWHPACWRAAARQIP